jgi:hypothetical protein
MPTGGQTQIKIRLSDRKNTAFVSRQQQRKPAQSAAAIITMVIRFFVESQSALF